MQYLMKYTAHLVSTFKGYISSMGELKKILSIPLLPDHKVAPQSPTDTKYLLNWPDFYWFFK